MQSALDQITRKQALQQHIAELKQSFGTPELDHQANAFEAQQAAFEVDRFLKARLKGG